MRLAALLMLSALAACARPGGPAPVVDGDPYRTGGGTAAAEAEERGTSPAGDGRYIAVRRGDTLYSLAREHGISLRELIDRNRLAPPFIIEPGQRLALPTPRSYTVQKGDTVYGIARRFGVEMRALVRTNDIGPPYTIAVGQQLRLPGAQPPVNEVAGVNDEGNGGNEGNDSGVIASARAAFAALLPPGESDPAPQTAPGAETEQAVPQRVSRRIPGPATLSPPPPRESSKFLWPVRGRILVRFGARGGGLHNDGINIAAREGTPVLAADAGVVAYAGNELPGFGNLVLIKHAGGWMSAYAHGQVLLVSRGDVVRRGQTIARVGRTGNVNSPQLHFELRRGDRAVDPTGYLVRLARYLPGMPVQLASLPAGSTGS